MDQPDYDGEGVDARDVFGSAEDHDDAETAGRSDADHLTQPRIGVRKEHHAEL